MDLNSFEKEVKRGERIFFSGVIFSVLIVVALCILLGWTVYACMNVNWSKEIGTAAGEIQNAYENAREGNKK